MAVTRTVTEDHVIIVVDSTEVNLHRPVWYVSALKEGLKDKVLRDVVPFSQAVLEVPQKGKALQALVGASETQVGEQVIGGLPRSKNNSLEYAVSRANAMGVMLRYWVAFQLDCYYQPYAQAASNKVLRAWVYVLATFSLLAGREAVIKAKLTEAPGSADQSILELWHMCDAVYIQPARFTPSTDSKRFEQRLWEFGESSSAFLLTLMDMGQIEGKSDEDIRVKWATRTQERLRTPEADTFFVQAIIDTFVNLHMENCSASKLQDMLSRDSRGNALLTRKSNVPAREQRPRYPADTADRKREHGAFVAEAAEELALDFESLEFGDAPEVFYGEQQPRSALVQGWADLEGCVRAGILTSEQASAMYFNEGRPRDGKFGKACPVCGKGRTEECTWDEWKAAHDGRPPYGHDVDKSQMPGPHQVIVHVGPRCPELHRQIATAVENGTAAPTLREDCPESKKRFYARFDALNPGKGKGGKGKGKGGGKGR